MPHNHPPRCCCPTPKAAGAAAYESCPSCVEHGELATLSKPHAIAYNPADEDTKAGHCHSPGCDRDYDQRPTTACRTPGVHDDPRPLTECPRCHATTDQPHTDYCRAGRGTGAPVDLIGALSASVDAARARRQAGECPSCHTHDGHPHTDYCRAPNGQRQAAGYPEGHTWGGKIHPRDACNRAWCGWAPITSQPPTTTTTPDNTHLR